jgi:uncharacterized protein
MDFVLFEGESMKITRLTAVTLGVADLIEATRFYQEVLGTPPNTSNEGVTFIELPGTWLSLFPLGHLAADISPQVASQRGGFSGFTLAYNARSKEEVKAVIARARSAGARIWKEPQEAFWGGFHAYFADLDGYYWEVVWGPMFDFTADGALKFKATP